MNLPGTDITVVHRAEGSGTTYIWVDYLSKVSPEFKAKVGVATAVNWPVGVGGQGSDGVTGLVKQTPGAFGYVELIYALQNKISYGSVQNMAGEFVKASLDSVTAAAASAASKMPADFRVSITNAPGTGVYPISSFTWLLLYQNPKDKNQAKSDGGLREVGAGGRSEVLRGSRLCAAPAGSREDGTGGAGHHQDLLDSKMLRA